MIALPITGRLSVALVGGLVVGNLVMDSDENLFKNLILFMKCHPKIVFISIILSPGIFIFFNLLTMQTAWP